MIEPIQPGAPLDLVHRINPDRNRKPGFGGELQYLTEAGWHPLYHAGAFEAHVIADYQANPLPGTQAGAVQRELYLEDITYAEVSF